MRSPFRFRLGGFAAVAVVLAFVILFRALRLAAGVPARVLHDACRRQSHLLVPIVPNRGVIVDRSGTVLARNYSAFTLEITPSKVPDLMRRSTAGEADRIQAKDRKRFKLMDESKNFESIPCARD